MAELEVADRTIAYDLIDLVPPWETKAETLILHHGVGADRMLWGEWLPVLADRWRIVRFDMFGCGGSSSGGDRLDWSLKARVRDVAALADAVGAERFHLVGESYGGTVAMATALEHPGRVANLCVSNAAHQGGSVQSVGIWREMIDRDGVAGWSRHMMGQRFFEGALPPAKARWYEARQGAHNREAILGHLDALVGADIAREVGTIAAPTLLLHGDSSPFIPVSVMEDLHQRIPGSELQVFAHARHGLPFSHGRACAKVLRAFLERRG